MKRIALTAIGRDKPGIVANVTKALFNHDCNIEDSSMTILQDEFSMILITKAPDKIDMEKLQYDLKAAGCKLGLTINITEMCAEPTQSAAAATHLLSVTGADKAGIVFRTSELLAQWKVNITDLSTKILRIKDKDVYIMMMEVFLPEELDSSSFDQRLDTLAKAIGVEISLKEIERYEHL
jgi:glycine cleavage system transcriptional repressor